MSNVLPLDQHIQWRAGTTSAINKFAGVEREFVLDTTKNTLVLLSGTAGMNYPLARESRTITAGSGIKLLVDNQEQASVTLGSDFTVRADLEGIVASDKGLAVDANGKLGLNISLSYNAATGVVTVADATGNGTQATVTIPSHTSALQSATVETATAAVPVNGQTTGTFLHFTWLLTSGSTTDTYIDVTTLVDVYTVGNGLQVNAQDDKKFEVKAGNGISADANGTHVQVKSGEAIIKSEAAGVSIDQTALKAVTDQTIVSTDANNVIMSGSDDGAMLKIAANGLLKKNASNELEVILDFGTITE